MRILAGLETEYGLFIEGRGAEDQVEDSEALVGSYPHQRRSFWDYRWESPRTDLRGFTVDRLAEDPVDAQYDRNRPASYSQNVRNDQILPSAGRFYNDHGHPEYATPECWTLNGLAKADMAGELVVLEAAKAFSAETDRAVSIYKNNTDYHGASYGSHESYLVPRTVSVDSLIQSVMPMLIVRSILCGSGKVGAEPHDSRITYQLSQRADFMVEPINVETLYRRPIFNTRDEPQARSGEWIRLHVISGDANMISSATKLRAGLVKLALALLMTNTAPKWSFADPVNSFKAISRDLTYKFEMQLTSGSTTGYDVLDSYLSAADKSLDLDEDLRWVITQSRHLLNAIQSDFSAFSRHVDWAAKLAMLESTGLAWDSPEFTSYDLEYHNVDREEGLSYALKAMNLVEPDYSLKELESTLVSPPEPTRALARSMALKYPELVSAGWRTLVFEIDNQRTTVELDPARDYSHLRQEMNVESFIEATGGTY